MGLSTTLDKHRIGRLAVDITIADLDLAMALRPQLEALASREFPALLARVFDRLVPADRWLVLDTLTLDLGRLRTAFLEADAVAALETALESALVAAVHNARQGEGGRLITPPAMRLHNFEAFLNTGLVLYLRSNEPFDPVDQLEALITEDPAALIAMLRRASHSGYLLDRLVLQLGDTGLERLLVVLAPADAAVVLGLIADTILIHRTAPAAALRRLTPAGLHQLLWATALDFLLHDAGSQFNRRQFLYALLTREAQQLGIPLAALLALLTAAVAVAVQRSPLASNLPRTLAELLTGLPEAAVRPGDAVAPEVIGGGLDWLADAALLPAVKAMPVADTAALAQRLSDTAFTALLARMLAAEAAAISAGMTLLLTAWRGVSALPQPAGGAAALVRRAVLAALAATPAGPIDLAAMWAAVLALAAAGAGVAPAALAVRVDGGVGSVGGDAAAAIFAAARREPGGARPVAAAAALALVRRLTDGELAAVLLRLSGDDAAAAAARLAAAVAGAPARRQAALRRAVLRRWLVMALERREQDAAARRTAGAAVTFGGDDGAAQLLALAGATGPDGRRKADSEMRSPSGGAAAVGADGGWTGGTCVVNPDPAAPDGASGESAGAATGHQREGAGVSYRSADGTEPIASGRDYAIGARRVTGAGRLSVVGRGAARHAASFDAVVAGLAAFDAPSTPGGQVVGASPTLAAIGETARRADGGAGGAGGPAVTGRLSGNGGRLMDADYLSGRAAQIAAGAGGKPDDGDAAAIGARSSNAFEPWSDAGSAKALPTHIVWSNDREVPNAATAASGEPGLGSTAPAAAGAESLAAGAGIAAEVRATVLAYLQTGGDPTRGTALPVLAKTDPGWLAMAAQTAAAPAIGGAAAVAERLLHWLLPAEALGVLAPTQADAVLTQAPVQGDVGGWWRATVATVVAGGAFPTAPPPTTDGARNTDAGAHYDRLAVVAAWLAGGETVAGHGPHAAAGLLAGMTLAERASLLLGADAAATRDRLWRAAAVVGLKAVLAWLAPLAPWVVARRGPLAPLLAGHEAAVQDAIRLRALTAALSGQQLGLDTLALPLDAAEAAAAVAAQRAPPISPERDPAPTSAVRSLRPAEASGTDLDALLAWLEGRSVGAAAAAQLEARFMRLADAGDSRLREWLRARRGRAADRARWAAVLPMPALGRLLHLLAPQEARALHDGLLLLTTAAAQVTPFGSPRPDARALWALVLGAVATTPRVDVPAVLARVAQAAAGNDAQRATKLRARALKLAGDGGHAGVAAALRRPPPRAEPVVPRPEPQPARFRMRTEDVEPDHPIHIGNAGLVIVHPYLPLLFDRLGLISPAADGKPHIASGAAASRACHLLQYLVDGRRDAPEPLLVLNKILCGVPTAAPVARAIDADNADLAICDDLLGAVIANWPALRNTAIAGLQETFLQRDGRLRHGDGRWSLTVQRKTLDVLTDQLPWGLSVIYNPWMPEPLHVTW